MKKTLKLLFITGVCLCGITTVGNVVLYIPFDSHPYAVTPEMEIKAEQEGRAVLDEAEYVEGIRGKAARIGRPLENLNETSKNAILYSAPWLENQNEGTVVLWYKDPEWIAQPWRAPALFATGFYPWAKTSDWQTPISFWIYDRLIAPPEQGESKWYHWKLENERYPERLEHTRALKPRETPDGKWHLWALRWSRSEGVLEVIDNDAVRDISGYESLIEPGNDYWVENYLNRPSKVYEDPKHIKFDDVFMDHIQVARNCRVTLDEIVVWDRMLAKDEIFAAYRRGVAGEEIWPDVQMPAPDRTISSIFLDMSDLPAERPPFDKEETWQASGFFKHGNRKTCDLDGYWRFQPASDKWTAIDTGLWGRVHVPWIESELRDNNMHPVTFPEGVWRGSPVAEFEKFWLERDFVVPPDFKGGLYLLRYDALDELVDLPADIDVVINGKFAGRTPARGPGQMNVSSFIKPGVTNRIALGTASPEESLRWTVSLDFFEKPPIVTAAHIYVVPDYAAGSAVIWFELENHMDQNLALTCSAVFSDTAKNGDVQRIENTGIMIQPGEYLKTCVIGDFIPFRDVAGVPTDFNVFVETRLDNVVVDVSPQISVKAGEPQTSLRNGDKLVFCGDSITSMQGYTPFLSFYLNACVPQLDINCAVSAVWGEDTTRFLERMDSTCIGPFNPGIVTMAHGINDSKGYGSVEIAANRYRENMIGIIEKFQSNDSRMILSSTSIHANQPRDLRSLLMNLNNRKVVPVNEISRTLAGLNGFPFAEVHASLLVALYRIQKSEPGYDIIRRDGLHPDPHGHIAIATAFLRAMGLGHNDIARIEYDPASGTVKTSEGHTLVSLENGVLTLESVRYPFFFHEAPGKGVNADTWKVAESLRFFDDLNRFVFIVKNPEPGDYEIKWGNAKKTFSSEELAIGINLAREFPVTPFAGQSAKVFQAVRNKLTLDSYICFDTIEKNDVWIKKVFLSDMSASGAVSELLKNPSALEELAQSQITESRKPVVHTVEVRKIEVIQNKRGKNERIKG